VRLESLGTELVLRWASIFRRDSFAGIPSFRLLEGNLSKLSPESNTFLDHNLTIILNHAQMDALCQQCQSLHEAWALLKAERPYLPASLSFVSIHPPTSASLPSHSVFFRLWPETINETVGNFCLNFIGFSTLNYKDKDTTKYVLGHSIGVQFTSAQVHQSSGSGSTSSRGQR
jgi:hypothetical protein